MQAHAESPYSGRPWLDTYPSGMPADLESNGNETGLSLFLATAASSPDHAAIHYFDDTITFAELDTQSDALASYFVTAGVEPGDRVAVYTQNDPQFVVAQLAIWKAGAIMLSVNPMLKSGELRYVLEDAAAVGIVALESLYDDVVAHIADEVDLRFVVTTSPFDWLRTSTEDLAAVAGGPRRSFDRPAGVDDLLEIVGRPVEGFEPRMPNPDDPACLVYTSGTSGRPKGVSNTHANIVYNSDVYQRWMDIGDDDVFLSGAPLFHITGLVAGMALMYRSGMPIVLYHRHNTGLALRLCQRWRCTFCVMVVTAYSTLMDYPEIGDYDLTTLTKPYSGGAPVSPATSQAWFELTGSRLHNIYGLTETTSPSHAWPLGADGPVDSDSGALSVGVPVPGAEVRIVDPKTLADVPVGEVGEIWIRGPMVTPGYWERPDANAESFVDGYLRTGDVGKMDDQGWFYLVDRLKDMINVAGYKVWPREVEDCLYGHPDVAEAAVVGVADDYRGETVQAYVVRRPGSSVTEDEIIAYCRERLAAYKYPRLVAFADELPKTASGKILRRELRAQPGSAT